MRETYEETNPFILDKEIPRKIWREGEEIKKEIVFSGSNRFVSTICETPNDEFSKYKMRHYRIKKDVLKFESQSPLTKESYEDFLNSIKQKTN